MSGLAPMLRKELRETLRTWRVWVLPGIALFFGVTSPLLALVTPALLRSVAASQPGVILQIPTPTGLDALGQFLKNLTQLVALAVVFTTAGAVSGEVRAGTAVLVLTKPVTRGAFILAKATSNALLLVGAVAAGAVACAAGTRVLFGPTPLAGFAAAVAVWCVFGVLLQAAMILASTWWDSQAVAAGAGLGLFAVLALVGSWRPGRDNTPAGLQPAAWELLAGRPVALAWPVSTGLGATVLLVWAAAAALRRREL